MGIDTKTRNKNMKLLYEQGSSLSEIGRRYSISRQRVSAILYSMGVEPKEDKKTYESTLVKKEETHKKKVAELEQIIAELRERNHKLSEDKAEWYHKWYATNLELERQRETNRKQREDIKALKDNSIFKNRIAELEKKIANLRSALCYYKSKGEDK